MSRAASPSAYAATLAALLLTVTACGSDDPEPGTTAPFEPCGALTAADASEVFDRPVQVEPVLEVPGSGTCQIRSDDGDVRSQVIGSSNPDDRALPLADPSLGDASPIEVPGAVEAVVIDRTDGDVPVASVSVDSGTAYYSAFVAVLNTTTDREEQVRLGTELLTHVLATG